MRRTQKLFPVVLPPPYPSPQGGGDSIAHDRSSGLFIGSFVLSLLLAGCSAQPIYKPVTVEVPVFVPCQPPIVAHAVWPTQSLSGQSALFEQVKALLAENELRQGYEVQLEAALQACR